MPTLVPTPSTPSAPTTTTTRPQPPQPPDDDPSSSDSSSSSSSSDDSGDHSLRRKKKSKKKSKRATSKAERHLEAVTKLHRGLSSSAACRSKVKTLKNDTNPKTRRTTFFNWISGIHDIFERCHPAQAILANYPNLPTSLDSATNEAVAAFLRSHVDIDIQHLMNSIEQNDGLGSLLRLKTICASATLADQQRPLVNLQNLEMHDMEGMTSVVSRFRKSLQALHHATADPSLPPQDKLLAMMFIQTS
jgi:hypothetical protein